jgi:hypothetical protein
MKMVPTPKLLRHLVRRTPPAIAVVLILWLAPGAAGSGPSITPVVRGTLGANGWYRSNVTVNWQIQPLPASSSGCDARTLTADTAGAALTCSATWSDGTAITVRRVFRIDRKPPVVRAAPDRRPDANGWYNHPLTITFSGVDVTSGVSSCSRISYPGPDTAGTSVGGRCTDRAGNVGSTGFALKYDSTPPRLARVGVFHGNRRIRLRWVASGGVRLSEVVRSPAPHGARGAALYRGSKFEMRDRHIRPGAKYDYTVTVWDKAANRVTKTVPATGTGPLTSPVPAAHVKSPPRLTWTPVWRADFYNVQIFHHGRKVMSVWPTHTHLALPWTWRFRGRRHSLTSGIYFWYVWPGYRGDSGIRYGHLLGASTFVVRR